MKYTSKLTCLCLILSSFFQVVLAEGNCSEDYLLKLGMKMKDEETTKPKVFLTSTILMTLGKKMAMRPGASKDQYFEKLLKYLAQFELDVGEHDCVRCFSESTKCVVGKCKHLCVPNPCQRKCQKCIESNCKKPLLECIGQEDIVNPCTWEAEYLNFKHPVKKILEDEDGDEGASGSG